MYIWMNRYVKLTTEIWSRWKIQILTFIMPGVTILHTLSKTSRLTASPSLPRISLCKFFMFISLETLITSGWQNLKKVRIIVHYKIHMYFQTAFSNYIFKLQTPSYHQNIDILQMKQIFFNLTNKTIFFKARLFHL